MTMVPVPWDVYHDRVIAHSEGKLAKSELQVLWESCFVGGSHYIARLFENVYWQVHFQGKLHESNEAEFDSFIHSFLKEFVSQLHFFNASDGGREIFDLLSKTAIPSRRFENRATSENRKRPCLGSGPSGSSTALSGSAGLGSASVSPPVPDSMLISSVIVEEIPLFVAEYKTHHKLKSSSSSVYDKEMIGKAK